MKNQGDKLHFSRSTNSVVCQNLASEYRNITKHLIQTGQELDSRNGLCKEVLNFKTTITNPLQRCVGGYNRDINIFFLIADALWLVAGRNDVAYLDNFLPSLKQYSDDGITYHGAYGYRIKEQIEQVCELLTREPNSRRAVIQIWDRSKDLDIASKDIPCNTMLYFNIRQGALHLTISNRSNDLHRGLCTNVFQFSFLLEVMALRLGLKVGTMTHNSASLHYYYSDEITQRVMSLKGGYGIKGGFTVYFDFYKDLKLNTFPLTGTYEDVMNDIHRVIEHTESPNRYEDMCLDIKTPLLNYWFMLLHFYSPTPNNWYSLCSYNSLAKYMKTIKPDGFDYYQDAYYVLAVNRLVRNYEKGKEKDLYVDEHILPQLKANIPFLGSL